MNRKTIIFAFVILLTLIGLTAATSYVATDALARGSTDSAKTKRGSTDGTSSDGSTTELCVPDVDCPTDTGATFLDQLSIKADSNKDRIYFTTDLFALWNIEQLIGVSSDWVYAFEGHLVAEAICVNGGNNTPSGQWQPVGTLGVQFVSGQLADKNGKLEVSQFSSAVDPAFFTQDPVAAGCPNENFYVAMGGGYYTGATVTFTSVEEDENGDPVRVITIEYTCSGSGPNGYANAADPQATSCVQVSVSG